MPVTVAGVVSGEFHEDCFSFVILVRVNLKQQKGLGKGGGGRNSGTCSCFSFAVFPRQRRLLWNVLHSGREAAPE